MSLVDESSIFGVVHVHHLTPSSRCQTLLHKPGGCPKLSGLMISDRVGLRCLGQWGCNYSPVAVAVRLAAGRV